MKKAFYFIGINDTDHNGEQMFIPELQEGSVEYHGKLYIHRHKDYEGNPNKWRLSHVNTGAAVLVDIDLASARMLAKLLQPFTLWEIKTHDEIQQVIVEGTHNPEAPYHEELKEIRKIRYMRA